MFGPFRRRKPIPEAVPVVEPAPEVRVPIPVVAGFMIRPCSCGGRCGDDILSLTMDTPDGLLILPFVLPPEVREALAEDLMSRCMQRSVAGT